MYFNLKVKKLHVMCEGKKADRIYITRIEYTTSEKECMQMNIIFLKIRMSK